MVSIEAIATCKARHDPGGIHELCAETIIFMRKNTIKTDATAGFLSKRLLADEHSIAAFMRSKSIFRVQGLDVKSY